jgi:lysophospholipase L1-like esterase
MLVGVPCGLYFVNIGRGGVLRKHDKIRIVCFGDSVTKGPFGGGWVAKLQKRLDGWQKDKFKVLNKGGHGDTTALGLDRIERDVFCYLPGVVLVEFGINDSNYRPWSRVPRISIEEFKKNLREFHRVITSSGGKCIFIVNHNPADDAKKKPIQGNGKSVSMNLAPYNDAIRETARSLGAAIIDMSSMMDKQNADSARFVGEDGVHLSKNGNEIYAEVVFEKLRTILENN